MQANTGRLGTEPNFRELSAQPKPRNVVGLCIIGLILVGLLASQAAAVTSITSVNVTNKPDCVTISLQGNGALTMTPLISSHYLGFQFPAWLSAKGGLMGIHGGKISNVRYSRYRENPPLARIVLNSTGNLDYFTEWSADKTQLTITVYKFGAPAAKATDKPAAKPDVKIEPKQSAVAPVLPPLEIEKPTPVRVARAAPPAPAHRAVPASSGAGKTVSLNFLGAEITDVLKALSIQSGENIVVGSDVTGTITVTLDNITVEQALEYICQLSGYTCIKDNHTYLVGSPGVVGGLSDAKIEVITLSYTNADDVLQMLKVQFPQVRTSKISMLGGTAKSLMQEMTQGGSSSGGAGGAQAAAGGPAGAPGATGLPALTPGAAPTGAQPQPGQGTAAAPAPSKTSSGITDKQIHETFDVTGPKPDEVYPKDPKEMAGRPPSNMIALIGSADKVEMAKAFVEQIESSMKSETEAKKVSLYQVKYVDTKDLANAIMSLVPGVTIGLGPTDQGYIAGIDQTRTITQANLMNGENATRPFDNKSGTASHSLILVGKEADVQKALDTAAQLDIPMETDLVTYKVKYVDPNLLANTIRSLVPAVTVEGLGIAPASSSATTTAPAAAGASASAPPSAGSSGASSSTMSVAALDNLSRTLVLSGRKTDVAKANTLIAALDVKSPQIKIDAKITSITANGEKKLGLSYNWGSLSMLEDYTAPAIKKDDTMVSSVVISPNVNVNKSLNRFWRQPLSFGATLDALVTQGDGKVLAAPSLICLEGKPGQFFVGDEVHYVVMVQQTPQGNNVTTDTANVGVQLSVVGNVSSDGYITLNLHPEVSVLQLTQNQQAGITLPTITRRYTNHVVRVKDGQTIVIGGLINDNDLDTLSKVPILGDLPIIGQLFRHRDKTKDHSEVVIFITASIVND